MSERSISLKLIAVCLLVVFFASFFAANKAGIINLGETVGELPFLGSIAKKNTPEEAALPAVSAVESENIKLRADLEALTNKIALLEGEKSGLQHEIREMKFDLDMLTEYKAKKESALLSAEELAAYYKEMKPEAIVKVMDKLDDDTVVSMLPLLKTAQAAKILALLEPHRAALLTQLLLRSNEAGG